MIAVLLIVTGLFLLLVLANIWSPNKRIEYEITPNYGIEDWQFYDTISVILGPPLVQGNKITALHNGNEIFPAMLDVISNARKTINIETFIYWKGDVGKQL